MSPVYTLQTLHPMYTTFSHLCMHMQKKVHATSLRNIFTFTLDQTHPHPHSHKDRHTFLDTQAHTTRARTPARAHSEHARAPGCSRTGFFWNGRSCRGSRGSHQMGGARILALISGPRPEIRTHALSFPQDLCAGPVLHSDTSTHGRYTRARASPYGHAD